MTTPTATLIDWPCLDAYAWLNTPVWVFDTDRVQVLWANNSALRLWQADSLQALQERGSLKNTPASQTRLTEIMQALPPELLAAALREECPPTLPRRAGSARKRRRA